MSSITQITSEEQEVNSTITKFFKTYQVGNLLRSCNDNKEKGVPVMKIFYYLITLIFTDRSMYMQMKTDSFKEDFSKNTIYRFLSNTKINWHKFVTYSSCTS